MLRAVIRYIEPYDPGLFPEDLTEKYGIPASEVINLGSNENPHPPPPTLLEEISSTLKEINRYPHPSYRTLKEKIADYVDLDESYISVGAGASELLDNICKIFLDPLDKVVVPIPTYMLYILLAMLRETQVRFVETEDSDFQIDAETLIEASKDAKMIFMGSPNNPTGTTISSGLLEILLDSIDGIVVLDETYHEFSDVSAIELVETYNNIVIVRSMSKYFSLAGLRIGYSISNSKVAEAIERIRLPFSISRPAIKGALKALEEKEYFHRIRDKILSERDRLFHELRRFSFIKAFPSQANFILIKVLRKPFDRSLTEFFAERGIIVRGLMGLLGLSGEYIRVSVGKPKENSAFIKVCGDIEKLVK